jgi:hypothetical protein
MNSMMTRWSALSVIAGAIAAMSFAAGCGDETSRGGGGSGTTSGGAGGGGSAACLDGAQFADLFAIADAGFCAVGVHTADVALGFQAPSWGSHGGPLTVVPEASGGGAALVRWAVPATATGKLEGTTTSIAAGVPDGGFLAAQAVDLPFFGWTALAWQNAYPDTTGKIVMAKDGAVGATYDVNGAYAFAGAGAASGGRFFYTALSRLGKSSEAANGLYAADACASPQPDLGAGAGCSPSLLVAGWGDSSGPVAVDADGNVFAVLASVASGDQEARGFAATQVAPGAGAVDGASLFTLPGFGSALAALAPRDGQAGLLAFQPMDPSAAPLDVVAQPYTVTSGAVVAQGAPTKLLTVPATNPPSLYLMSDAAGRLWVAATSDTSTTFVVLARKS